MKSAICRVALGSNRWSLLCMLLAMAGQPDDVSADWPGWRGAARNGVAADFQAPTEWPRQLKQVWKVEVGEGHASPAVAEGRIFVFSRQGEAEVVAALDLDGKKLWTARYAAPYKMNPAAEGHGKGPKSTPLVAGGRVFTLGISGILSCWKADSGERVWQQTFAGVHDPTSPLFGTAMSPLLVDGQLLAHVGGHEDGAFCAFDPATGRTRWSWDKDGPAYTSPILVELAGARQIVTQTQQHCLALSPQGKELWRFPYETQYVQNIVTPVVFGDTVVFSGYNRGVTGYRVAAEGGQLAARQAWHNKDVTMYMSSPVLVGNRLIGFSQTKRGQLFCLDAGSGRTVWLGPPSQGENASLTVAGGVLLILTDRGELAVADPAGAEYRELARYRVAETPSWAHLVPAKKNLLIKDAATLSLWSPGT